MKLEILNTSILTAAGSYKMVPCSLNSAKFVLRSALAVAQMGVIDAEANGYSTQYDGVESAIGHEATAQILSEVLGEPIPFNRIAFTQAPGQTALVFKLKGRAQEGVILTREQIDEIGYEFFLLIRSDAHALSLSDAKRGHHVQCVNCGAQDPEDGTLEHIPCDIDRSWTIS